MQNCPLTQWGPELNVLEEKRKVNLLKECSIERWATDDANFQIAAMNLPEFPYEIVKDPSLVNAIFIGFTLHLHDLFQ